MLTILSLGPVTFLSVQLKNDSFLLTQRTLIYRLLSFISCIPLTHIHSSIYTATPPTHARPFLNSSLWMGEQGI